jgi:GNAT superfamily N-acetyltransferase
MPPMPSNQPSAEAVPGGLIIRRAVRTDVAAIIGLFIEDSVGGHGDTLEAEVMPTYLAAFDALDRTPTETLFVAVRDGRVIGTYQLTIGHGLVHRARVRATIESVHVAASERGRGVGAAMMRHGIVAAGEKGAGVVQLTSNKRRADAHRFYERLGFSRSHEGFKMELPVAPE